MTFYFKNNVFLQVVFNMLLLYQMVPIVKSECLGQFSLSDEEYNPILEKYLEKLENYTGLSEHPVLVPIRCPSYTNCIINPQGSAIWQARLEFYTPYTLSPTDDSTTSTLYSCVCDTQSNYEFQDCLRNVRLNMLLDLDIKMIPLFQRLVENDACATFEENCQ